MKRGLERSYLVQSAKRFFPEGTVPENPSLISPGLKGKQLKPIQKELADILVALRQRHETRRESIQQFGLTLTPSVSPLVHVVNGGRAAANIDKEGTITVDVRVLQSIFRGAVLTAHHNSSPLSEASQEVDFDWSHDHRTATDDQSLAIGELLDIVREIEGIRGRTLLGDMVGGFDSPWFITAGIVRQSERLRMFYSGAVLFLLAHEQGHLALDHFSKLDELDRIFALATDADDYCEGLRLIEQEADLYALLLLSPHTPGSEEGIVVALGFEEFNNIAGFRSFFRYGYNLSGFTDAEGGSCTHETNQARYEVLATIEKALMERSEAEAAALMKNILESVLDPLDDLVSGDPDRIGRFD